MKKYIASKEFYMKVLAIAFPIMIQNGISNFVNLLDNIMIGRVGTEQMSGVSIVNQLLFVFILCLFGTVSGAGILGAQFFGQKNMKGVGEVFRIKLVFSLIALIGACAIFINFAEPLISLYLHEGSQEGDLAATLRYGQTYLKVMLLGLPPMALEMTYSSTLRESGETKVPMRASVLAVFINLVLNYILIFGKFGAPVLGVAGAAYATVVSRYIQMIYVVVWTHRHEDRNPYIRGLYSNFHIPGRMLGRVFVLALPLMLNETLWSAGMAAVNTCYSYRGLAVVAALNIQSTIYNIFNIMFIAMGDAIAIIVGQQLGAGEIDKAKDTSVKIIAMAVFFAALGGLLMFTVSGIFPGVYNTTAEVRSLAATFIRIIVCFMPIHAFLHAVYFTIRSGGKTVVTFLFDSVYLWVIAFPFAYVLARFTNLDIRLMFTCCQAIDLIKVAVGFIIYRSGIWARNLTSV
ncbi:MATE family efflux transporter [Butyrivibrio sp. MC2013]|uniref:MATE family efflux transporter n=1 Tax=Butyrivibrio sp. MC2013 TaxID=1280686 RepID=UPI00041863FB|nr:MATE family efflux transporter [Butyrivibrio sp. MC2013]